MSNSYTYRIRIATLIDVAFYTKSMEFNIGTVNKFYFTK